ncbi:MAG: hypothetical protein K2K64_11115 [Muribaculaceae bacterium]|nr:hypothetical protein [Muribaculaceae bacterium]
MSNRISLPLEVGLHRLGISYLPEDENMNIKTNHPRLDHLRSPLSA